MMSNPNSKIYNRLYHEGGGIIISLGPEYISGVGYSKAENNTLKIEVHGTEVPYGALEAEDKIKSIIKSFSNADSITTRRFRKYDFKTDQLSYIYRYNNETFNLIALPIMREELDPHRLTTTGFFKISLAKVN